MVCLIYNYAQHYRGGIFKALDKDLKIESYFGDKMGDIKKLDYNELNYFKKELTNINLMPPFYWQKGVLNLLFKPYNSYIFLGEYYCLSTWLFLLLAKFSEKKIVLWTHGWYGNESFLKKIIKKTFFKLSDSILLYGDYAKSLMVNEGFDEKKLHVIYNSLDYYSQIEIRNKLKVTNVFSNHFQNNYPVLLFIGRLTEVKKLDYVIKAQKDLIETGFPVNLVFIGTGVAEENLKNFVVESKTESMTWFYGSCYDEAQIGNLIYNADICVSPGNVGLTAMHSMVYGTPVISHDNFPLQMPEFEAIVKGETGDFFKYDDISSLTDKIRNWLKTNTDRNSIRNKCFNRIDNYFNPNFQLKIIKSVLNEK
ncbi:glycosyltransferase [Polaribacter sp. Z014]|uniref:glycosyltransferase n=1 Tax=Polaribacter sp. Z014 TaxID=2927126 RepID=UPI0020212F42|nr:glycosyltransferase [Polaribacter sp. Z014]MCL7763382.1 glycosyltransferase [Polaribacter sp. Z014]